MARPASGMMPPTDRFTKIFDSDKREAYSADKWAKDVKRYMREVASGPAWDIPLRTRIARESVAGTSKARKSLEDDFPEVWFERDSTVMDFHDGLGPIARNHGN